MIIDVSLLSFGPTKTKEMANSTLVKSYFFADYNNKMTMMTPDRHCLDAPNISNEGPISTPPPKVAVSFVEVAKIAKRKSRNSSLAPMKWSSRTVASIASQSGHSTSCGRSGTYQNSIEFHGIHMGKNIKNL